MGIQEQVGFRIGPILGTTQLPCLERVSPNESTVSVSYPADLSASCRLAVTLSGVERLESLGKMGEIPLPDGIYEKSDFVIFNRCILDCSVVRFNPKRRAAPFGPEIIPSVSRSTRIMCSRSAL